MLMFHLEHFLQQGTEEHETLRNKASSCALVKVDVPATSQRRDHPDTADPRLGYVNAIVIHLSAVKNII